MMAAAGRGGRVRLEACSPRLDAALSTEGTLPTLGAGRTQADKLAAQRGSAKDDGGDRYSRQKECRVSAMMHEGSRWTLRTRYGFMFTVWAGGAFTTHDFITSLFNNGTTW